VLVFGAALAGMAIGARLPEHHRSDASRNVISVAMAVVGTLTALVLGLLLSIANTSFRTEQQQLISVSTDLLRIDQLLRAYGPETDRARSALRQYAAGKLAVMLFLSAVAASGTIVLIIDLEQPYRGLIHLPAGPLQHAGAVLNR
jgi:hypothetical protein